MEMPLPVIALESFRHCTTPKPPHVRPVGHPLHPNAPYIYEHGIFALMTLLKSNIGLRKGARATRPLSNLLKQDQHGPSRYRLLIWSWTRERHHAQTILTAIGLCRSACELVLVPRTSSSRSVHKGTGFD